MELTKPLKDKNENLGFRCPLRVLKSSSTFQRPRRPHTCIRLCLCPKLFIFPRKKTLNLSLLVDLEALYTWEGGDWNRVVNYLSEHCTCQNTCPALQQRMGDLLMLKLYRAKPRIGLLSGFKFSAVRSLENKSQVRENICKSHIWERICI